MFRTSVLLQKSERHDGGDGCYTYGGCCNECGHHDGMNDDLNDDENA